MIFRGVELLIWAAGILWIFAGLALAAEILDRRERRRERLAMRAAWRREWLVPRTYADGEILSADEWNRTLDADREIN